MTAGEHDDLVIRRASDVDLPGIILVLKEALGWVDDEFLSSFLAWKHEQNSFGRSLAWVAESQGDIVGYRTFLRWRFLIDGEPVTAVRAVDTATRSDQQRRGIFSRLTMAAVDQALDERTGFVFNTPNGASGPGYLKLGWMQVGHVPIAFRPRNPLGLLRRGGGPQPVERLSEPSTGGDPATVVLAGTALTDLLASQPPVRGITTDRSAEHLRWRYSFGPLHYRAVTSPDGLGGGVAVFRVRQRGSLRHAMVTEVLAPGADRRIATKLLRAAVRASGADVALCTPGGYAPRVTERAGFVTSRRRGPLLVWRPLDRSDCPPLGDWRLALGDTELF